MRRHSAGFVNVFFLYCLAYLPSNNFLWSSNFSIASIYTCSKFNLWPLVHCIRKLARDGNLTSHELIPNFFFIIQKNNKNKLYPVKWTITKILSMTFRLWNLFQLYMSFMPDFLALFKNLTRRYLQLLPHTVEWNFHATSLLSKLTIKSSLNNTHFFPENYVEP